MQYLKIPIGYKQKFFRRQTLRLLRAWHFCAWLLFTYVAIQFKLCSFSCVSILLLAKKVLEYIFSKKKIIIYPLRQY